MHPGIPELRDLEQLLGASGSAVGAAQAHGILTGLTCATAGDEFAGSSVGRIIDTFGINADFQDRLLDVLMDVQQGLREQLAGPGFEFQPVTPDDSEPVPARVEALADWCRGFILGLLEGGVDEPVRLPADAGEAARDLVELGAMGVEPGPFDKTHERAIAEVEEYVRVAVQLIYEELHAHGPDDPLDH
jgi:hypothetical protein